MNIVAHLGNLKDKRMSLTVKDESIDEIMEILNPPSGLLGASRKDNHN